MLVFAIAIFIAIAMCGVSVDVCTVCVKVEIETQFKKVLFWNEVISCGIHLHQDIPVVNQLSVYAAD